MRIVHPRRSSHRASISSLGTGALCLVAAGLGACRGEAAKRGDTTPVTSAPAAASKPTDPALGPGEAMLPVGGGRIWYKVSGSGSGTPMVLLHGGPGAGSYYLKPFEAIGDDRRIIRYDQLGAGKSDRLTDTTLMKIPRYRTFLAGRSRPS